MPSANFTRHLTLPIRRPDLRSTRARIPRFVIRGSEQHTPDFLRLYTLFMLSSFGLLTHRTAHRAASPVKSCRSATRKQSLQHLSEKSLAGPSPARGPETGLEKTNGDLLEADFWPGIASGYAHCPLRTHRAARIWSRPAALRDLLPIAFESRRCSDLKESALVGKRLCDLKAESEVVSHDPLKGAERALQRHPKTYRE